MTSTPSTAGDHASPRYRNPLFWRDLGERVGWTALQAGLAVVTVELLDVPLWAAPIVASSLSAVKGYVASKVTANGTASTATGV